MITEQRHIDLHLPTGWNRCTTEELEAIAAAIVEEQAAVGRYRHFLWERVKVHIVLNINRMQVLESDGNGEVYLVQRGDEEPWPISTEQLADLCERLNWLTDEKADKTIFMFPYPSLTIDHLPLTIQGPPPLLDGYTWREYRWLTDWMQEYMRQANAMAQVKSEKLKVKNREAMEQARNEFLAVLFKPAGEKMFNVQCSMFNGFSPVKWQVILFWWSSLMSMLAKKFPRVFKSQPINKGRTQKQDTPWDFYNRVTATLADEYKTSEQDQRNETYSVTLQKLQNMAEKAAELERISRKK